LKKAALFAVGLFALATFCHAEPRWCTITGIANSENLAYPPIARVARVYGVVLERVTYLPKGVVQSFEYISGPKMLASGLEQQMNTWSIATSAAGDQPCVSLVIAEFNLDATSGESKLYPPDLSLPGILRLKSTADVICLCDPGGDVGKVPILKRWSAWIRRAFSRRHKLDAE